MLVIAGGTGGGLFTSTSPELRRVKPENVGKRKLVKVVYVVLEAQYQSSLSTAVKMINAGQEEVRGAASRVSFPINKVSPEFEDFCPEFEEIQEEKAPDLKGRRGREGKK